MTAAPHDALFKAAFSQVDLAAEELRCVLPAALVARMDFSTLSLEAGSFVDEELREQHTDLLYSVTLAGQRALAYILFEHQSSGEQWMALRLLRYMLRIWDKCVVDGGTRLPVIIPVVLHHGASGWRAATCFEGLFDLPPEAAEFTPYFRFALDDLAVHSEASLRDRATSAFTRLVLSALQQIRGERQLDLVLRGWSGLIRELSAAPNGQRGLQLLFQYIFEVRGADELAAIETTASELGHESEENMETIAQFLRRQGRQEGRQEGSPGRSPGGSPGGPPGGPVRPGPAHPAAPLRRAAPAAAGPDRGREQRAARALGRPPPVRPQPRRSLHRRDQPLTAPRPTPAG
jgi:predicted transposase/invertase (TIGR01784 family)